MKTELSKKEEKALKLILAGYTQVKIGELMCLSQSRVQDLKSIIKRKWGVKSDVELVLAAVRRGFLEVELDTLEYGDSSLSCSRPSIEKLNYIYIESLSKTIKVTFK